MNRDLVRAAKAGDEAAREAVWRWCTGELERFFRGTRVSSDSVPDLVQRTTIEVFKKFEEGPDDPAQLGVWIRAFGSNIEQRWWREVGRYTEVVAEYEHDMQALVSARSLESDFAERERLALIDAAIERLPSPYRTTLRLFNAQHDTRTIAAMSGVAEGTVRWRLSCARQLLDGLIERSPETGSERERDAS